MNELKQYIAPEAEIVCFSARRPFCATENEFGIQPFDISGGGDGGIELPDDDL